MALAFTVRTTLMGLLCTFALSACSQKQTSDRTDSQDTAHSSVGIRYAEKDSTSTGPDSLRIPLRTPDDDVARFAFRSGEVQMKYSGDLQGIRRLVFDDYGLQEFKRDSAVPSSSKLPIVPPQIISIMTRDFYGVVDTRAGTGEKAPNQAYGYYLSLPEIERTPYGEIALQRSNGTRLPDTVLLGQYYCRVYRQEQPRFTHTIWVWGGIPIMEQLQLNKEEAGSYLLEPVQVQTNIDVPDSTFTFPAGYQITEVTPPPIQ